jgi:hypothetical protein
MSERSGIEERREKIRAREKVPGIYRRAEQLCGLRKQEIGHEKASCVHCRCTHHMK